MSVTFLMAVVKHEGENLGEKGFTLAYGLRVYCLSLCQGELTHIWRDQEGQRRPEAGPGYKCQGHSRSDHILQLSPTSRWCHRSPSPSHYPQTKCSNKQMSRSGHFTSKPNDHRDWSIQETQTILSVLSRVPIPGSTGP